MADQLYLSYWLHGFSEHTMPKHWETVLRLFPYSRLSRGSTVVRVTAIDPTEPVLFERGFPDPVDYKDLVAATREFQAPDCSWRVETWWELWQYDRKDWKLQPARVAIQCFGPDFENEEGHHLRLEFGLDTHFLPIPEMVESMRMAQENLKGLLKLVHELDNALPVERRRLETESGENFAERLQDALDL